MIRIDEYLSPVGPDTLIRMLHTRTRKFKLCRHSNRNYWEKKEDYKGLQILSFLSTYCLRKKFLIHSLLSDEVKIKVECYLTPEVKVLFHIFLPQSEFLWHMLSGFATFTQIPRLDVLLITAVF